MKQYFILTALACISFVGYSQVVSNPVTYSGPALSVESETYDYGTILQGSDPYGFFNIVNSGTAPLIFSNCKGSCGCTVPDCDKAPIMPGDTTTVKVKYDTNRVGPINKSVTITSNALNTPVLVLRIKGMVQAPAVMGVQVPKEGTEE